MKHIYILYNYIPIILRGYPYITIYPFFKLCWDFHCGMKDHNPPEFDDFPSEKTLHNSFRDFPATAMITRG